MHANGLNVFYFSHVFEHDSPNYSFVFLYILGWKVPRAALLVLSLKVSTFCLPLGTRVLPLCTKLNCIQMRAPLRFFVSPWVRANCHKTLYLRHKCRIIVTYFPLCGPPKRRIYKTCCPSKSENCQNFT